MAEEIRPYPIDPSRICDDCKRTIFLTDAGCRTCGGPGVRYVGDGDRRLVLLNAAALVEQRAVGGEDAAAFLRALADGILGSVGDG